MSKSNPKRKSTKAGVALSADARRKLQQLADWIEGVTTPHDPRVRFSLVPSIIADPLGNTWVSIVGALVQMFAPFKRADARKLMSGMYAISWNTAADRAINILGITRTELNQLISYWYAKGHTKTAIVQQLRSLK